MMHQTEGIRIVAGMATMPSRTRTARFAIRSILRQVDVLYLYLDGFDEVPSFALQKGIEVLRSQDFPGLKANGKLLGLHLDEACTHYVTVDDDYWYPADFVKRLRRELEGQSSPCVIGVHGSQFSIPFHSFTKCRKVFTAWKGLKASMQVCLVATCGTMHLTKDLRFDVRSWKVTNQVDLHFAGEMIAHGLTGRLIKRGMFWLKPLGMNQRDSIFSALKANDFHQTQLAKKLFKLS